MELGGRKKLHALSLAEKIQVLELLRESKLSQSEVARRFRVSQPQISRICKNKEKLLADWCSGTANRQRKRKRESKYSGVDEALLCWYRLARAGACDVTGPALLHKAKQLADIMGQDFVPSVGWLVRWRRRNNVGPGPRPALTPPPPGLPAQPQPPVALEDFCPEDVFGCAAVPLLYRAVPGGAGACDRVQVVLCANSRGSEKRRVWAGGRQAAPACFSGVRGEALPASYHPGLGVPWAQWLARFDRDMGLQGRHVALLLAAPVADAVAGSCGLHHVRLLPLSASGSTPALPCSVVRAFKARYRCRLLGKLAAVRSSEAGLSLGQAAARITVLDALHMAAAAWARVPPQLIWGSFVQEGLAPCKTAPAPSRACEMPPVPGGLSPEEFSRFVDLEGEDPGPGVCKEEALADEEEGEGAGAGEEAREPPPTKADALRALRTLRRWLECNGTGPELLDQFYGCEEGVERLCCL